MRKRDHLLGPPGQSSPETSRPLWLLPAALGFLTACLLVGAYAMGRNDWNESRHKTVAPPQSAQKKVGSASTSASEIREKPIVDDRQQQTTGDLIITERLLKNPLSWEDFQEEAVTTSVCIGEPIKIANAAARTVGLVDTPEESDATVSIGIVRAGNVLTIRPKEAGTFYISEADGEGLLFRYDAKICRKTLG